MFGARYFGPRYYGGRYFAHVGDTAPGYFFGPRFYGSRYFGRRFFGSTPDTSPASTSQTAGLSVTATVSFSIVTTASTAEFSATILSGIAANASVGIDATTGSYSSEFIAGAPLALDATASITFGSPTVVLGFTSVDGSYFGGRYFGQRFYGSRYWSTKKEFEASVTAGLSVTAVATLSGSVGQVLEAASLALSANATVSFTDFTVSREFAALVTAGLSVSADVGFPNTSSARIRSDIKNPIPGQRVPLTEGGQRVSSEWYRYLQTLDQSGD